MSSGSSGAVPEDREPDHVAAGRLRVNIEARVPLDNAPDAFGLFADGTLGKVLISR